MAAGALYAWGDEAFYQTGLGKTDDSLSPTTVGMSSWIAIAAGTEFAIAINDDGTLWGWGINTYGQVGNNSFTTQQTPTQIAAATWTKVATGTLTSYAIKSDGTLWAWGCNGDAQLGDGTYNGALVPTQVGSATWTDVTGCGHITLAIQSDGTLWSWGTGTDGQLGLGGVVVQTTPAQVGSATWLKVAGGFRHSMAIKSDGTLWGWGAGAAGQLGDGAGIGYTVPTQIGSATWVAVDCGKYHTLAIKSDGTLWAAGEGVYGKLGTGSATNQLTFVQIGSDTWAEVAGGDQHSVAIKTDATLWAVGANAEGQIGDGSRVDVTSGFAQIGAGEWQLVATGGSFTLGITGIPASYRLFGAFVDTAQTADASTSAGSVVNVQAPEDTAAFSSPAEFAFGLHVADTDTAAAADTLADSTFTFYLEAIGLSDSLAAGANTTTAYADSAAMLDVIQQAINQIVADSAAGADSFNLGAALTLVDIADAVATQTSSVSATLLVAELIATLEAYNGADGYDIAETGTLSDAYVARVEALVALLDEHYIQDVNVATVSVYQLATDSADSTTDITSAGSLLNALLADSALATIRLNIGGELFTGWVLNTDTLAPSEYQFADLQFNSACKHGDTYLLAADDGIYQFTEDTGVETVMTYIKTGKTDFGSDLKKRIVNSYMVYSASGQMVLKVTTSEFGKLVTRNYRMTPQADDTTATRRIDIGKGIKSRYWQFEVVGDGVDCDIDEIGMLPVVLSRRI